MADFKAIHSPLILLIAINVLVFIAVGIAGILHVDDAVFYVALAGMPESWLERPWGILTYMFVQIDFLNLLFNMLWLWAFGTIIVRFENRNMLVGTYIASGLAGGVAFIVTTMIAHLPSAYLIGASASVLGIIAASATRQPKLELNLFIFGNVQLRWVALIAIVIFGVAPGLGNAPTLAAHIAGCVTGVIYALVGQKRFMLHAPVKKSRFSNVRLQEKRGLSSGEQAELDNLLERIQKSGYKSLTMSERGRLFDLSNKINSSNR